MLAVVFAAIWFGYRAKRADKNPIGWGLVGGVLTFGVLKVLVTLMAINADVSSQEAANVMLVLFNILLFGGPFSLGFLIQPKQESSVSASNHTSGPA